MSTSTLPLQHRHWPRPGPIAAAALVVAVLGFLGYRTYKHSTERKQAIIEAVHDPAHALPALKQCLERDPADPELLSVTVAALIRTNAPVTETEEYIERWIMASPNDVEAHRARVEAMILMYRHEEAIASAERIVELAPERDEVRSLLGSLYLKVGRWDDAAREFGKLVQTGAPTAPLIGLARAELERGHRMEAMAALDRVLKDNPQATEARMLRGLVDFQLENYSSALSHFQKARPTTANERVFLLYHIGVSLDRLGRQEEAKQAYAELRATQTADRHGDDARQRPDDVDLQIRAATSYLAAKQPETAHKLLQDALARIGHSKKLLLAVAESCDALGRPDEARRTRLDAERAP